MGNKSILIVDDEASIRQVLKIVLESDGFDVQLASNANDALLIYKSKPSDIVLLDLNMPDGNGLELLKELKKTDENVVCILMTAFNTWETAVEAMRCGAYDYFAKPFNNDILKNTLNRAINLRTACQNKDVGNFFNANTLRGNCHDMQLVFKTIKTIAKTDTLVLLRGESGTGKDMVARQIHYNSYRFDKPFLALNCGALSETLMESELFGHCKGAFTGATSDKKGMLEAAGEGTIFLDEIGDMSLTTQIKLLRVLENKSYFPVGSTEEKRVNARIIAATHRPLEEMITQKTFRADLFYRLNIIPIEMPPLRQRGEDLILLSGNFLTHFANELGKDVTSIDNQAMQAILNYDWPGNIRELQNVIQRAVALCENQQINIKDLNLPITSHLQDSDDASISLVQPIDHNPTNLIPEEGLDLEAHLLDIERQYLKSALEKTQGNLTEAAKLLNMSFRSIRYRVKKLDIR